MKKQNVFSRIANLSGLLSLSCAATLTFTGFVATHAHAFDGSVREIVIPDSTRAFAIDVNNFGEAVIYGQFANNVWKAFRNSDEAGLVELPGIGGTYCNAASINNLSEVVGNCLDANNQQHMVHWDASNNPTNLGNLGAMAANVTAINDVGSIAGAAFYSDRGWQAFIRLANGQVTELGHLGGGQSIAFGLNNKNHVVGYSMTAGGAINAFFWANGEMVDLGNLGGGHSVAVKINDNGKIAGSSRNAQAQLRAVGWTVTDADLGSTVLAPQETMRSNSSSINPKGNFVGDFLDVDGVQKPALWTNETTATTLPSLPQARSFPEGLSSIGHVAGWSWKSTGERVPTVWKSAEYTPGDELAALSEVVNAMEQAGVIGLAEANVVLTLVTSAQKAFDSGRVLYGTILLTVHVWWLEQKIRSGDIDAASGGKIVFLVEKVLNRLR